MNLNDLVGNYDNQRIFTLTKTASGVGKSINENNRQWNLFVCLLDMSSRQRLKATNDIFEMISENDEDIKFDECGILKPVTVSKSTIVIVILIVNEKR